MGLESFPKFGTLEKLVPTIRTIAKWKRIIIFADNGRCNLNLSKVSKFGKVSLKGKNI
jgi:hypothetical protein